MRLVYFAWVREAIGADEEDLQLPADVATTGDLLDWLAGLDEAHGRALADPARIRVALDGNIAALDASLAGVREIAIFPPVTGG